MTIDLKFINDNNNIITTKINKKISAYNDYIKIICNDFFSNC